MIITRTPFRITLGGGGTDLPSYYEENGGFLLTSAIDKYMYVALNTPFIDKTNECGRLNLRAVLSRCRIIVVGEEFLGISKNQFDSIASCLVLLSCPGGLEREQQSRNYIFTFLAGAPGAAPVRRVGFNKKMVPILFN